jgi:hypothetical protein
MNIFNIERAFKLKVERKWDTIYVVVDAHGTMIRPYHETIEFYTDAIEVLRWMTRRKDIKLIMWTSSHIEDIVKIFEAAEKLGIYFDLVNGNNFEKDSKQACFSKKFYFNILLDDKAGFEPETDWKRIKNELTGIGEWNKE